MAPEIPKRLSIIDEIYDLQERVSQEADWLRENASKTNASLDHFSAIVDAVDFLDGQGFGSRLGLSDMDLGKFHRWRGDVGANVLLRLTQRVQSLLRELEGQVSHLAALSVSQQGDSANDSERPETEMRIAVQPIKWVVLPRRANAELIADISSLLDEAVYLARTTNLPPDKAALSDIERAQLVALLETTLAILKAPLVEKGLLKKVADAAKDGAASAVTKKAEFALGYALGKVGELIVKLLAGL